MSDTQKVNPADNKLTSAVHVHMHPTMLAATAAVLSTEDNNNIHFGGPEVNHNEIKPNVVNEVAQSVVRQGPRSKDFQPFGSDMEVFITKTTMVSIDRLQNLFTTRLRHGVGSAHQLSQNNDRSDAAKDRTLLIP